MKFTTNFFVATLLSSAVFAQDGQDVFNKLSTVSQSPPKKSEPVLKFYDDSLEVTSRMPPSDLLHLELLDKHNRVARVKKPKNNCYCGYYEASYALVFSKNAVAYLYEKDDCMGEVTTLYPGFSNLHSVKKFRSVKLVEEKELRCSFGYFYETPIELKSLKPIWEKNDEDN